MTIIKRKDGGRLILQYADRGIRITEVVQRHGGERSTFVWLGLSDIKALFDVLCNGGHPSPGQGTKAEEPHE